MKAFPTLYKKTNTGAIQSWSIAVDGPAITVVHGQVGGKLQTGVEIISEGKNLGRSNETTPEQQAEAEAEAKHTKQLKKGYVFTSEAAQAGEVDAVIEGGILPMLAPSKVYPHFSKKLVFPVYVQPKLDGSRCIAIIKGGVCTLWSRTRKQIHTVPHIVAALERAFPWADGDLILDGELYNHEYRADFEQLMSLIRPDEPVEGHEVIQYHVYDLPSTKETFAGRWAELCSLFGRVVEESGPVKRVRTAIATDDATIRAINEQNLADEYEGSMIRNDGPYEFGKRSNHLQKFKTFVDGEFKVVGAEEGRGKDAGTVGAFNCLTADGKPFKARLKATYDRRRELFQKPEQWRDRWLTVAYQNLTADGIPRFPIGKGFRIEQ